MDPFRGCFTLRVCSFSELLRHLFTVRIDLWVAHACAASMKSTSTVFLLGVGPSHRSEVSYPLHF